MLCTKLLLLLTLATAGALSTPRPAIRKPRAAPAPKIAVRGGALSEDRSAPWLVASSAALAATMSLQAMCTQKK